jgi:hypothetical protein
MQYTGDTVEVRTLSAATFLRLTRSCVVYVDFVAGSYMVIMGETPASILWGRGPQVRPPFGLGCEKGEEGLGGKMEEEAQCHHTANTAHTAVGRGCVCEGQNTPNYS